MSSFWAYAILAGAIALTLFLVIWAVGQYRRIVAAEKQREARVRVRAQAARQEAERLQREQERLQREQEERLRALDTIPVRTELTVLPADPPRPPIGLPMHERLGIGVTTHGERSPANPRARVVQKKAPKKPDPPPKPRRSRKRRSRFDRINEEED